MSSSPNSSSSSKAPAPVVRDGRTWLTDVPCAVDFVLGTATVTVRDCVQLAPNGVIRLRQTAGSDIEVRVGGVTIATGEGLMVEKNLGLRLNRIVPPAAQELL